MFYFVLSIVMFYIYHTVDKKYYLNSSSYYYNDKYLIYENVYYISIVLFSMISFFVYLFAFFNKKKKNVYSNQYDLLAIRKFYLVQLGLYLVTLMIGLCGIRITIFPVIFTSFFVVVMYYYFFYGKSLLERKTINYSKLKKLFLIMELFFSISLFLYFKVSIFFALIVLAIN